MIAISQPGGGGDIDVLLKSKQDKEFKYYLHSLNITYSCGMRLVFIRGSNKVR